MKITKENIDKPTFTGRDVLVMLRKLAMALDPSGYSRALDTVEDLTGDRDSFDLLDKKDQHV